MVECNKNKKTSRARGVFVFALRFVGFTFIMADVMFSLFRDEETAMLSL